VIPDTVCQKLEFAKTRLDDLNDLIANNQLGSNPSARHQLSQEFFFHLVGSIEYLAQLVNERRSIGFDAENVAVHEVIKRLGEQDAVLPLLKNLSANTRKRPFPANPYADEGLIYRVINYRNEIVHRHTNPFHFTMSSNSAFFYLDPRNPSLGQSAYSIDTDLSSMYSFVRDKCHSILAILG
jgi:hypothetical protein